MDRNKVVVLPMLTWVVVITWYLVTEPTQNSSLQSTGRLAQQDQFVTTASIP